MTDKHEVLISVDVETSGPIPGVYSLLTLGACCIDNPTLTFECELKPTTTKFDPKALEITGLSLERLKNEGVAPEDAMRLFKEWVIGVIGEDSTPVFVGFNAPFDWSFINYYFHRYLGENPFGFSALDIKSMYLGATGCSWTETRSSLVAKALKPKLQGDHDALHDAMYQAELFRLTRLLIDRQKS